EADVSENERGVCILSVEDEDSVIAGSSSIAGSFLDDVYTGKRLPSFIRDLTGDRDEGVCRFGGDYHQTSAHAAIGKRCVFENLMKYFVERRVFNADAYPLIPGKNLILVHEPECTLRFYLFEHPLQVHFLQAKVDVVLAIPVSERLER